MFNPPDFRMASAYRCPKCGKMPHVEAVKKVQAVPEVLGQFAFVSLVRKLSYEVCTSA